MTYINNQYIRLDIPIKEIAKIEIKTDEKNKLIEELDIEMIGGEYPNVVIAYGEKVEYNNIFTSIRILITNELALKKNEYKIPEYIEKIIVYGYVYENNNRGIERIKEGLKNGIELIDAIERQNNKLALDILKRENININRVNEYGYTALIRACRCNKMETVALKLLEREDININETNKYGDTALIRACWNNMESVALKLLEREEININQVNDMGETALMYACYKKMEGVALKLLEREEININKVNKNGETALILACYNNMENVALKLLERKEININQKNYYRKTALDYAIENNMKSVIKRINELNNK